MTQHAVFVLESSAVALLPEAGINVPFFVILSGRCHVHDCFKIRVLPCIDSPVPLSKEQGGDDIRIWSAASIQLRTNPCG